MFSFQRIFCTFILIMFMTSSSYARVYSGLEVFLARYTHLVKGKRVGLVTNQTGVNAEKVSTIDIFHKDPRINLVALFAPEHGIRGDIKAGETVPGGKDSNTGLPIYTLYGANGHKPTKQALDTIDVLIYDIQDVGSRAYTYIWHLAECMSAATPAGKEVIVLDRPNILGAKTTDGPITEKEFLSFIGLYPVPRVYGMTVGELAYYLNNVERIKCRLTIVPMMNYNRGITWDKTGLPWIAPSPNIPNINSAYCFAATGTIGETSCVNIGIGTNAPFQIIAAPWIDGKTMAEELNKQQLPGVLFQSIEFVPEKGIFSKQKNSGVYINVTNPATFLPTTTETAILCHLKKFYANKFSFNPDKKPERLKKFDKAMGTSKVRIAIESGYNWKQISHSWLKENEEFRKNIQKYLIYK